MRAFTRIVLVSAITLCPCCASVLGIDGDIVPASDGGASVTGPDGSANADGGAGAEDSGPTSSDGAGVNKQDASDAAESVPTIYNDMTDASLWSTFDTTTVNAGAEGFYGAAFDGRYIYFVPYEHTSTPDGIVTRYDTQASFTTGASWSVFDTTTVNTASEGFNGAAFDGRYVYFVPYKNGAGTDGIVTRYDTQSSFTAGASWSVFDMSTVNAAAKGFNGATFDGRYVYFVPLDSPDVARYDTQASFTTSASWAMFDTTTVNAGAQGFWGAVFDGRYVYLVPYGGSTSDGIVTRYDTQASFTTGASWSVFDTTTVNAAAKGFVGAAFDGRYVYFVPSSSTGGSTPDGIVTRYDTQATFATGSSWSVFDTTTLNAGAAGFNGAAFDGRYVYFVPLDNISLDGIVTRYDTQASFTTGASWSVFDTTTVNAAAKGFLGGVFDGRYVYFVPSAYSTANTIVTRFDAKTPPSMPKLPGWNGSFL